MIEAAVEYNAGLAIICWSLALLISIWLIIEGLRKFMREARRNMRASGVGQTCGQPSPTQPARNIRYISPRSGEIIVEEFICPDEYNPSDWDDRCRD